MGKVFPFFFYLLWFLLLLEAPTLTQEWAVSVCDVTKGRQLPTHGWCNIIRWGKKSKQFDFLVSSRQRAKKLDFYLRYRGSQGVIYYAGQVRSGMELSWRDASPPFEETLDRFVKPCTSSCSRGATERVKEPKLLLSPAVFKSLFCSNTPGTPTRQVNRIFPRRTCLRNRNSALSSPEPFSGAPLPPDLWPILNVRQWRQRQQ